MVPLLMQVLLEIDASFLQEVMWVVGLLAEQMEPKTRVACYTAHPMFM